MAVKRVALWPLMVLVILAVGRGSPAVTTTRSAADPDRPVDLEKVAGKAVLVVPIRGEIGIPTYYYVKRSVQRAKREHVGVILFEFDTPGGRVDATIEICRELARQSEIPTIGLVNPAATSGGAIMLAAVNHIYMRDASTTGAAAPIMVGPQGGVAELDKATREKYNSFLRTEVRAWAERNGHPFALFQAMIDFDLAVSEVLVDGRREIMTGEDIDNLDVRKERGEIREYRIGELIIGEGKLLSLTNTQAKRWGLSRGSVTSRQDLLARIGMADFTVTVSNKTGSEQLARFLTHRLVVLLLMLVGAIGIYVELNTPGFGVPGAVGIGAFAVLFLGQYVAGLAGIIEPLLFVTGVALLAIEIFVTPGFGFLGAAGMLLMLISVILAGQDFALPSGAFQRDVFERNVTTVFGGFILSAVGMALLARYLPRTRAFNLIALRAPADAEALHGSAVAKRAAVGDRGLAATPLRPGGRARFGEQYLDVVAEGQFLTSGTAIVVLRVDGNRVVVGPVRDQKEDAS